MPRSGDAAAPRFLADAMLGRLARWLRALGWDTVFDTAASRTLPGPVRRCPTCARVYWPGSHARRMRAALQRALPGWLP